jgi:GNAT superfamily N-acetyltransferase
VTLRVVAEHRRRGVGTALHLRASEHAQQLGKPRFYAVVRDDDPDSLGYYRATAGSTPSPWSPFPISRRQRRW